MEFFHLLNYLFTHGVQGRTLGCVNSSMELGLPKVWASDFFIASGTTKYYPTKKKFLILFLSNTMRSITITPSDFPFLLPRFDFLFLLCCHVLGLLELGPLTFGVRWVFFWEGGLRFLMYTVVIFTFGYIAYIRYLAFIF